MSPSATPSPPRLLPPSPPLGSAAHLHSDRGCRWEQQDGLPETALPSRVLFVNPSSHWTDGPGGAEYFDCQQHCVNINMGAKRPPFDAKCLGVVEVQPPPSACRAEPPRWQAAPSMRAPILTGMSRVKLYLGNTSRCYLQVPANTSNEVDAVYADIYDAFVDIQRQSMQLAGGGSQACRPTVNAGLLQCGSGQRGVQPANLHQSLEKESPDKGGNPDRDFKPFPDRGCIWRLQGGLDEVLKYGSGRTLLHVPSFNPTDWATPQDR